MLVIASSSTTTGMRWSGRRHDDDASGASSGDDAASLFGAVFSALHDGEQVAVGFPAPLAVESAEGHDDDAVLERVSDERPAVRDAAGLLVELGRWRPWTVISTSLSRWRATTSVLVWEGDFGPGTADLDSGVEDFYALVRARADRGAEPATGGGLNLAIVAARRAGLSVAGAQPSEPVLRVARAGSVGPA